MLGLFKCTSEMCHGIKTSFQDTRLSIFMLCFYYRTSHPLALVYISTELLKLL